MSARDVVTRRIASQCRRFPDLDIRPVDVETLAPRDAALARAIDQAVARRWLTLQRVLFARLRRPWERLEPNVKAPLLVGAAQLLLLDRLPPHAVIDEAVKWTKRHNRAGAGGLVNAVLRGVDGLRLERVDRFDVERADELPLPDGSAWRLREPVFDGGDPLARLAAQTSHPPAVLARWADRFDPTVARDLALHDLVRPPIIMNGLEQTPAECVAHAEPGFSVLQGGRADLTALLGRHPEAWVQDPSSAAPIVATSGLRPSLVVDLCAGQGTKTRQLARLHPGARIVATDIDAGRRRALREVFTPEIVEVIEFDTLQGLAGQVDLLVLDVPCSNTGVLPRRVEARYRATDETIESLVGVQRQLIADALPLLAEAGTVLYATCSIERCENHDQARWLTRWHDFEIIEERLRMPAGRPGDDPAGYSDGGYLALLGRGGAGR